MKQMLTVSTGFQGRFRDGGPPQSSGLLGPLSPEVTEGQTASVPRQEELSEPARTTATRED